MALTEENYDLKKRIQVALLTLLSTKMIEQITIKQITSVAFTNRTHFYYYFHDKYDVLQSIKEDYLVSIQQLLTKNHEYLLTDTFSQEQIDTLLFQNTLEILTYLKKEQHSLRQLLNHDVTFEQDLYDYYYQHFSRSLPPDFVSHVSKTTLAFISQGIFQICMEWIKSTCPEPPGILARTITDLLLTAIDKLII